MKRHGDSRAPALILALAPALLAACGGAPAVQTGTCRRVARGADAAQLDALFARYGTSLVIAGDAVMVCSCDRRYLASDGEGRRLAGEGEARRQGDEGEGRRLAGGDEARRLAGESEGRRVAGDDEGRRVAGDGEGRRLAGEGEARRQGDEGEGRRLGGEGEARRSDDAGEQRRLAGEASEVICRAEPPCRGYYVDGVTALRVYDGSAVRAAPDGCVAWWRGAASWRVARWAPLLARF